MIKRHAEQVWARLDELYANGTTTISGGELYHWYDVQKSKKAPWRDIKTRWAELLEEKGDDYIDPIVAETRGGYSFFFSRNPNKLSDLAK